MIDRRAKKSGSQSLNYVFEKLLMQWNIRLNYVPLLLTDVIRYARELCIRIWDYVEISLKDICCSRSWQQFGEMDFSIF